MGYGSSLPKLSLQQAWVRFGKLINLDGWGNYTLMTLFFISNIKNIPHVSFTFLGGQIG